MDKIGDTLEIYKDGSYVWELNNQKFHVFPKSRTPSPGVNIGKAKGKIKRTKMTGVPNNFVIKPYTKNDAKTFYCSKDQQVPFAICLRKNNKPLTHCILTKKEKKSFNHYLYYFSEYRNVPSEYLKFCINYIERLDSLSPDELSILL